jgi:hypothetical protein
MELPHGRTKKNTWNFPAVPWDFLSHRIHGAGIYANIGGILMGSMLPYIAYMDPSWVYNYLELSNLFFTRHGLLSMDPKCIKVYSSLDPQPSRQHILPTCEIMKLLSKRNNET